MLIVMMIMAELMIRALMALMLKMEAKKLYTPATHKRSSTLVQKFCSGAMLVTKVHQPGVLGVTIADIILDIGPLLKILQ